MEYQKPRVHLLLSAALMLASGCAFKTVPETIDSAEPVSSMAIIASEWHPGTAFVIDRENRLLLSSLKAAGDKADTEVDLVFPPMEDGKTLVNREKLKKAPRIKAKSLYPDLTRNDPDLKRDLGVLQADSIPDGVPEVKLAKEGVDKDAAVDLITVGPKAALVWARTSATVKNVAGKLIPSELDKRESINAKLVELNLDPRVVKDLSGSPLINKNNEVVGVVASDPAQTGNLMCVDVSEIRPTVGGAYRQLAVKALEKKNYDEALAFCDKALKFIPQDARTFNERGVAYSWKNDFAKAIESYTEAIKLDPEFTVAWRNRASADLHAGKYEDAVNDATEVLKLTKNRDPVAFQKRIEAYKKMGKIKEAEEDTRLMEKLTTPEFHATPGGK